MGGLPWLVEKLGNSLRAHHLKNGGVFPNTPTRVGEPGGLQAPGAPGRELNGGGSWCFSKKKIGVVLGARPGWPHVSYSWAQNR